MIINLFCDASIDIDKKIACAGCTISMQNNNANNIIGSRLILQENATNNSAEILAIWIGVVEALKIRQEFPNAIFRLFSDSKISLYGLRDWIKNWVNNITPNGILISSSGNPVSNQQRFIEIYNLIVENALKIELYHQRGHVNDGKITVEQSRIQFIRANKVSPENLGIDIDYINLCNSIIDDSTRRAVKAYVSDGIMLENVELEGQVPMNFLIRVNMLPQYIRNINKTSVISRHDFKGGYSQ